MSHPRAVWARRRPSGTSLRESRMEGRELVRSPSGGNPSHRHSTARATLLPCGAPRLRILEQLMRASTTSVGVIVLALLVAGAQHSLRLCRVWDHQGQTEAARPTCHAHAGQPGPAGQPRNGRAPACCDPTVALVSLPSAKGFAATKTAPTSWLLSGVRRIAIVARDPAAAVASLLLNDGSRGSRRFPRLRSHLAFRTILA